MYPYLVCVVFLPFALSQVPPIYYIQPPAQSPVYFGYPVFNNTPGSYNVNQQWSRIPPAASNLTHNLITGIPQYSDALVYNRTVKDAPFTRWGKVVQYVHFPPRGMLNQRLISVIQVLDHMHDSTGGWPFIAQGGIGRRNCTVKLKSQPGKAMQFQVLIYVRK